MRHAPGGDQEALLDVLDRVLTKGIVILFDIDVSVAGLRIVEITGRTTVMSIETYTKMTAPAQDDASNEALIAAAEEYLRALPTDAPHLPH